VQIVFSTRQGDGTFETEHQGKIELKKLLADRAVLLVLDDVRRRPDVDWFDVLGSRCRALITTRDNGLLTALGGVHHLVELLNDLNTSPGEDRCFLLRCYRKPDFADRPPMIEPVVFRGRSLTPTFTLIDLPE
jgi:hypothetical protein